MAASIFTDFGWKGNLRDVKDGGDSTGVQAKNRPFAIDECVSLLASVENRVASLAEY